MKNNRDGNGLTAHQRWYRKNKDIMVLKRAIRKEEIKAGVFIPSGKTTDELYHKDWYSKNKAKTSFNNLVRRYKTNIEKLKSKILRYQKVLKEIEKQ